MNFKSSLLILTLAYLDLKYHLAKQSTSRKLRIGNTVKQSGITTEAAINTLPIATQGKSQTISYFDGLSRQCKMW